MRKFILVTAMVLASAAAQAGATRGLTLASNEPPAVTTAEPPKAAETPVATEAPKYVARPAAVAPPTEAPKAETTKPVAEKSTRTTSAEKPKRRRESTEARVIRELHRHGIYW
ncbi:hypothetical protein [Bradyrhizobium sp.]|uniref:hypothetical protein n=1 Tax=Bradyrhizobium sp. TaxID=376 RepID=UPI000AB432F9|nr:hypothetical protein [Bradyrhizobium sp.]